MGEVAVHDDRAVMAANNNADWYQAMFACRGLRYERKTFAFVGKDQPPPYHSNLTILSPNRTDEILSELRVVAETFQGVVGFKDSFCEFDLQASGFEILFTASWIWRPAQTASPASAWLKVEHPLQLEQWEAAWKQSGSPTDERMFPEALLGSPDISFLGKMEGGEIVAGCAANLSDKCIGISNLFSRSREEDLFQQASAAVASIDPCRPIVGYVAGHSREAACRAGYLTTGNLRIMVAENARF